MKKTFLIFFVIILISKLNFASTYVVSKRNYSDSLATNYQLIYHSKGIEEVSFKAIKSKNATIKIELGIPTKYTGNNAGTAIGMVGQSKSKDANIEVPIFKKIDILKGGYTYIVVKPISDNQSRYKISDIKFPLRLNLHYKNENIEFEIQENSSYVIRIVPKEKAQ